MYIAIIVRNSAVSSEHICFCFYPVLTKTAKDWSNNEAF